MTIIAVTVHKKTKDVKTGLKVTNVNGITQILEIVPGSLFARSASQLSPGMRIVNVNNVECDGKSPTQVTQLVKDAQGEVILLVDDAAEPDIPIVPQASYDLEGGVISSATIASPAVATVPQATIVEATIVASDYSPPASAPTAPVETIITSTNVNVGAHRPPPGLAAGGTWGTAKYFGETTCLYTIFVCLCFPPFCCYVACCPQDEKDAYRINGKVYDANGSYIGSPQDTKFVPSRRR